MLPEDWKAFSASRRHPQEWQNTNFPIHRQCSVCTATDSSGSDTGTDGSGTKLHACPGCKVEFYCSKQHEFEHWNDGGHKAACISIAVARIAVDKEHIKMQRTHEDPWIFGSDPGSYLNDCVGRFWWISATRPYMKARAGLVTALWQSTQAPTEKYSNVTATAIKEALDSLLDMLRLSPLDPLTLRDCIPSLHLRLNREQECYDFIKWWATYDTSERFIKPSHKYLHLRGQDMMEDPSFIKGSTSRLADLDILLLLKLRIYKNLENLWQAAEIRERLPNELVDEIAKHMFDAAEAKSPKLLMKELKSQILMICDEIKLVNQDMMTTLLKVDKTLKYPESAGSDEFYRVQPGCLQEAERIIFHTYIAWGAKESQGCVELLNRLVAV